MDGAPASDATYDLARWSYEHRTALTRLLAARAIPCRFRDATLVVPAARRRDVEAVLRAMSALPPPATVAAPVGVAAGWHPRTDG
jgi:hypothetical protein